MIPRAQHIAILSVSRYPDRYIVISTVLGQGSQTFDSAKGTEALEEFNVTGR